MASSSKNHIGRATALAFADAGAPRRRAGAGHNSRFALERSNFAWPPDSGELSFSQHGASGCKRPQKTDGLGRLRSNRVVCVHMGYTNDPFLVDHIPRGHRQSVSWLVVESVHDITQRLDSQPLRPNAKFRDARRAQPVRACGRQVSDRQRSYPRLLRGGRQELVVDQGLQPVTERVLGVNRPWFYRTLALSNAFLNSSKRD